MILIHVTFSFLCKVLLIKVGVTVKWVWLSGGGR